MPRFLLAFRRLTLLRLGFLALPLCATAASDLTISPDRADAIYGLGDTANFQLRRSAPERATPPAGVSWTLAANLYETKGTLAENDWRKSSALVTGRMDEPGFLTLRVTLPPAASTAGPGSGNKPTAVLSAVSFAPERIAPSLPPPEDFETFWMRQKTGVSAMPAEARLTPLAEPASSGIELFDLQADCPGGAPVSGILGRPAGATPRSLPAILTLHGAGVFSANARVAASWAQRGFLALDINAHGVPNGREAAFYQGLAGGELRNYWLRGRESRDTIYFRGMFQRVLRALDVLAARPEWDGRILVAYGSSQGGAQAIVAGALDHRVSLVVAAVPALCDHTAALAKRPAGWPQLLTRDLRGAAPDEIVQASRYYDMVNFARLVRAPVFFTVGFIDVTCPPASVYAAYNAVPGEKRIFNEVRGEHVLNPEKTNAMTAAVLAHRESLSRR